MNSIRSSRIALLLTTAGLAFMLVALSAQQPVVPAAPSAGAPVQAGPGGGGRGRGGLPGATPEQMQAIADMNTALAALNTAVTTARNELAAATFADVKNEAGIRAAVEKVRAAELALAMGRATEFAKLQAGPNKLNAEQVTALIAAGGNPGGGGRGRGAGAPGRGDAPGAPPAGRGRG
jgi:Spy/CpxP family protein refolding chaperone